MEKNFKISDKTIIVSEELVYDRIEYEFSDVNAYSSQTEGEQQSQWMLMHYRRQSLTNEKRFFKIDSTCRGGDSAPKEYASHFMYYGYPSIARKIELDKDGFVSSDSIIDTVADSMHATIFRSTDTEPKIPLIDYLARRNHTYVNRNDPSDIFKNRWFKDEELEEYLCMGERLTRKNKDVFYPDTKQKKKKI